MNSIWRKIIVILCLQSIWRFFSITVPSMHFPELFSNNTNNGKKKKKSKSAFQPLKNPCLALNELRPGLEYKLLEQSGPVHMPTFKIAIDLDGQIFTGEGRYVSKKSFAFQFWPKKNLPKCIPEILLRNGRRTMTAF